MTITLDSFLRGQLVSFYTASNKDEYWPVDRLYQEKEKPLLLFPTALKSTFDISAWTAPVNEQGKISVYGVDLQLAKDMAKKSVLISLRVNGEVLVMDFSGTVLLQTAIPERNMHLFTREAAESRAAVKTDKSRPNRSNPLEDYSRISF